MHARGAVLTLTLLAALSHLAWGEDQVKGKPAPHAKLNFKPMGVSSGTNLKETPLNKALRENKNTSLLCTVAGKNYASTTSKEDRDKCSAMGGHLHPGVDNSAGDIKSVPLINREKSINVSPTDPPPGPHDQHDPREWSN